MAFATWWRGDALPDLAPLVSFSARPSQDLKVIAHLTGLSHQEVNARFHAGHQIYIAYMGDTPAAYGWIATREGAIIKLEFSFPIPAQNLYLWDFLTLSEWRGKSIYPLLLQEIIRQEEAIERFWIGYVPDNDASARGVSKAGFHVVSEFVFANDRLLGLALFEDSEQAHAHAEIFRLPVTAIESE